jgi:hypothetical protein
MQGNARKKAWISLDSFGRNGPFQWVTAEKIKNFILPPEARPGCKCGRQRRPSSIVARSQSLSGVEFVITGDYNPRFRFAQDNVDEFENSALPRDRRCGQRRNDPMVQPLLARARLTFR